MFKLFNLEKTKVVKPNQSETEKREALENYGPAEIDNPQILRLITAIDRFDLSPERVEAIMSEVIERHSSVEDPYTLAKVLADRESDIRRGGSVNSQILYGLGGFNRYFVDPNGKVSLLTGHNIEPRPEAKKKATELGMEIN